MTELDKKYQELVIKKAELEKKLMIKKLEKEIQNLEQQLLEKEPNQSILYIRDKDWWDFWEKQFNKGFYNGLW